MKYKVYVFDKENRNRLKLYKSCDTKQEAKQIKEELEKQGKQPFIKKQDAI